jgi:hypothetical protein
MAIVFNNKRGVSTVRHTLTVPAAPAVPVPIPATATPPPAELPATPQTATHEPVSGKRPAGWRKRKPLDPGKIKRLRRDGFGFYCCVNCKWFTKTCPSVDGKANRAFFKNGCKAAGILESAMPCLINQHGTGHFEPVELGDQVPMVEIDHLDTDELLLLAWRIRRRLRETYTKAGFVQGQRVRFLLNDEVHYGVVLRTNRHRVQVEDELGGKVSLHPDALQLDVAHPQSPTSRFERK